MSWYGWRAHVSVAEKRRRAERMVAALKKKGRAFAPVTLRGRKIANSFWAKSWCDNLERYSDFEYRLPRGRSYVRNGFVVDLQIAKGEVAAIVAGSALYDVKIAIAPVAAARWKAICRDCAGSIDSLVELLQGRLAKSVMDRVCREGDGLFPAPREIKLSCNCPDWATMCKHVAAALYGIGARLDEEPHLLFVLRDVDESELLAGAGRELPLKRAASGAAKVLDDRDVAALFGLEMAETANSNTPAAAKPKLARRPHTSRAGARPAGSSVAAAKESNSARAIRTKSEPKRPTLVGAGKRGAGRRPRHSA